MGTQGGIEVELKFRIEDAPRVRQAVLDRGGRRGETIRQVDRYFNHPVRDFAVSDEALRVRTVGDSACVTYKGPLLDAETKSREETELWFSGGAADGDGFAAVLRRLGFRPTRAVRKSRQPWQVDLSGRSVEIAFDEVDGLGPFVELETAADADGFETAKAALLRLARELGLSRPERRSYLALLLADDATHDPASP